MLPIQPQSRVGGNGEFRSALAVGLSLSLSMGFLDIAWNLARKGPPAFQRLESLLFPLAATTLAVLFLFGSSYLLLRGVLAHTRFFDPSSFLVALTTFWGSLFTLGTLNRLLTTDYRWDKAVTAATATLLTLVLMVNGYRLARSPTQGQRLRATVRRAVLLGPFLLAGGMLGSWLYYYGGGFGIGKGIPAAWIALTLVTGAIGWILLNRKRLLAPLPWMCALLFVVLLSPILHSLSYRFGPAASDRYPRRVVLITVDTLRADMISYTRPHRVSTPNMDALASDSVVFRRAISAGPWTLPAVSTILTGLSPAVHGAIGPFDVLPDKLLTLAERLRAAGFQTAAIGHNPFLRPKFRLSQGFETYDISPRLQWAGTFGARLLGKLAPSHFRETADTEDLSRLATQWIRGHTEGDFFLWLHYFDPHDPYHPPNEYRPAGEPPPGLGWSFSKAQDIRSGNFVPSSDQKAWAQSLYEAEVRYVDDNLGQVIQELKRLDLYQKSLVILASDHGEEFWEHGGYEHGHTLYDELIHVPWMVKLPDGSMKKEVWDTVSTGSITPVVLDHFGIEYSPEALSYPVPSALKGGSTTAPPSYPSSTGPLYFEDGDAVFFDHWKYIRWRVGGREELFDLEEDPTETRSLAESSESILSRARQILVALDSSAQDLRKFYGLPPRERGRIPRSRQEQLKSLGYIR